jgi:large subunit ribosomal protein L23
MAAKKKEEAKVAEWMYSIIAAPVVTEKSTMGSEHGQVTFKVPVKATKPEIKAAVEALFKVKVTKVNTLISKGKTKVFKGTKAFRSDTKKAIVTLEDGQTIDVGSGL